MVAICKSVAILWSPDQYACARGQVHGVRSAMGRGGLHAALMGHMHATWESNQDLLFLLVCYSFTWMAIVVGVW